MAMTEDEGVEKIGKQCTHCTANAMSPYEYDWTSFPCGYNVRKRKKGLTKTQRKEKNFNSRLKYA